MSADLKVDSIRESKGSAPFLEGRKAFEGTFGDLARGKRNWQWIAAAQTVLLAATLGAYLRLSLGARMVPYVVEVDRLGRAVAFGPAEPLRATDARITIATLSQLIRNLRAISTDAEAQREFLRRAYPHLAGDALRFVEDHFNQPEHDPRTLGERMTRTVEVTSVLRVPRSNLWRLQWRERELPRSVGLASESGWEALLRVELRPPASAEGIEQNPLGLYVTDLNWVRLGAPKGE